LLLLSGSLIWWKKHPLPDVSVGNAIRVAGIQMEGASVIEYMEETRKLPEGTQYVLWPEYAIPFDVRKSARNWQHLLDLCRERGITLTVGTQARPEADEWRNIALTMNASGYLGEHTKMHPVHFFNDGKAGTEASVVDTEHGLVGTPICFDADYEGVVRKMTAEGAEVIFIPTMDAESWSARQHDQHAELAHMRAAENARWIFACASSGVSQMIDPNGYVHQRLQALEQGAISGVVLRETKLSFYTQWGWLFGWVILGVGVVSWVLVFSLKAKPASPT